VRRHNGPVDLENIGAFEGGDRPDRPGRIGAMRVGGEIRAAIDLGTNSFHLLVARIGPDGRQDVLAKEKEVVRLGSGASDMSVLTDDAMDRGIEALRRFAWIAESFGATVDAIATSALREAQNRDVFLRRAFEETGIVIEVVSGVEEARLIHLGVLQSLPLFEERILVIDIGGGSTEFLIGRGTTVELARSTKLGAIRLTDRFFPDGFVRTRAVRDCRSYVAAFLVQVVADVRERRPFTAVGSSGTIVNIARIITAVNGGDPLTVGSGTTFSAEQLDACVELLLGRRSPEERLDIEGLDERRADIIAAGAVLLQEIFRRLAIESMVVSDAALREGILLDKMAVINAPLAFHHLNDIRRQSVLRMAEIYHEDLGHISRATDLALELFDALVGVHGLSVADRDCLEAAGLLHNVGLFVSHAAHHKHSYYVIRNSDQLAGFTDHEIEMIAQVARYHRKSAPKSSHVEFQALSEADQHKVRLLAGMLRIGIALDRTRQGGVEGITVAVPGADGSVDSPSIVIDIGCADDVDVSLEMYSAEERKDLLVSALGCQVELRFVSARRVS
jgi:exopolyphosphatase/guanosine-5'-triphosphate,3'-diphosphate pyrophosphatase